VLNLPRLLGANYTGVVIPFAENQTTSSFNALNGVICEYKVSPPATGPAIERCVNRYIKDLQAVNQAPAVTARASHGRAEVMYSVKGDRKTSDEDVTHITLGSVKDGNHFDKNEAVGKSNYLDKNAGATGGMQLLKNETAEGGA
jgi:hypothetical protein